MSTPLSGLKWRVSVSRQTAGRIDWITLENSRRKYEDQYTELLPMCLEINAVHFSSGS